IEDLPNGTCAKDGTFSEAIPTNVTLTAGDIVKVSSTPADGSSPDTTETADAIVPSAAYQGGELERLQIGVHGIFGTDSPQAKAFADLYLENGLPLFGDKTACS